MTERNDLDSHRESPIYKKAWEIMKLADALVEALPEDAPNKDIDEDDLDLGERDDINRILGYYGEMAQHTWEDTQKWILECAHLLPVKISGAEGGGLYDLQMENAALIRKACRELTLNMRTLQLCGYEEMEYMGLIRTAVEKEFKYLFRDWVESFDDSEFIPDSWGLFNPPGVGPDDEM